MSKIRVSALALLTLVLATVGAAYSSERVGNYAAYANTISNGFARGDNGSASGWRPCEEAENDGANVGMICEGRRAIRVQRGELVEVNYFCEFRFERAGDVWKVDLAYCQ